jgi:hypothetical protein
MKPVLSSSVVPDQVASEVCIVVSALSRQNDLHLVPPVDPLTVVVHEVGDLAMPNSIEPERKHKVIVKRTEVKKFIVDL